MAFFRNAQPAQDAINADGFTIDDLDNTSLITFRERISRRYPKKQYINMSISDFLLEIGACSKDRNTGGMQIKRGTLLFLGKVNSIKELFPYYHLDYFNHRGNNPRWSDRVSDDEPSDYEMNLYNFYTVVYEKIRLVMQESFRMDQK